MTDTPTFHDAECDEASATGSQEVDLGQPHTSRRSGKGGVKRAGRTWSLRREWSRAFIILLLLPLAASIGTFVGVNVIVGQFSTTTKQLDQKLTVVAALQADMLAHEYIAHQIVSGVSVDRQAFVRQQNELSKAFAEAVKSFPADAAAVVRQTAVKWQAVLTKYGLWGDQVLTFHGPRLDLNRLLGADSDEARGLLDSLQQPSLMAMRQGVASAEALAHLLLISLGLMFGLALCVTQYFRWRMAKDLVRPVARLHRGVVRLRAGDYGSRIEVERPDELGELAEAFNGMARALHESHLALTQRATHDSLTGLANRLVLTERLTASFAQGTDRRSVHESVLFIDVDDLKDVNDSLGHEMGDVLLTELAARLRRCVHGQDLVVRLGGDELAIVVVEEEGSTLAVHVAQRVLEALQTPFAIGDARLGVSVSIGVAQRRHDTRDAADLLRQADFAMYMAKGGGKGRLEIFDAAMHDAMVGRAALKVDLAVAASSGQLRLEYQPIADLRTGQIVGVEALVRWQHPSLGWLAPSEFIALAEETGDIEAIGCWVLDTATRQVALWRETVDHCANLWLAVNLSALQLRSSQSLASIERILAGSAAQAIDVVFEVTETALVSDLGIGIASLHALKALGVRIAIDDFGTGFSSLSTLASLPVDIVKIDRSFLSSVAFATPSVAMLEAVLGLAEKLNLDVIVEGIEDVQQLELLRSLGCAQGQGYFLARPSPAQSLEPVLSAGRLGPIPVAAQVLVPIGD